MEDALEAITRPRSVLETPRDAKLSSRIALMSAYLVEKDGVPGEGTSISASLVACLKVFKLLNDTSSRNPAH